jgi:radical SAM-linked protein
MTHREVETAWAAGLEAARVPVAATGGARPRPRLAFGAPVPVGVTAEREPLDLYLVERLTIADLRDRLPSALPPGHELIDLHDVWLGSPSITALVIAGDYRCDLADAEETVAPAVAALFAAARVSRPARKGDASRSYDLRPLVERLAVAPGSLEREGSAAARAILTMRLRLGSEGGSGRPDEVVEALAEIARTPLTVLATVRERLVLSREE